MSVKSAEKKKNRGEVGALTFFDRLEVANLKRGSCRDNG